MQIIHNDLSRLPVYTENNEYLGKIHSFYVDCESQSILKYQVHGSVFIQGLFGKQLLIDRCQVVSITPEKMIVEDAVVKDMHEESKKKKIVSEASTQIANKKIE